VPRSIFDRYFHGKSVVFDMGVLSKLAADNNNNSARISYHEIDVNYALLKRDKLRSEPLRKQFVNKAKNLKKILEYIGFSPLQEKRHILQGLGIKESTYSHYMTSLKRNGWIIRIGLFYELNPYVKWLVESNPDLKDILGCGFMDLHDLINDPLLKMMDKPIEDVKFAWSFVQYGHVDSSICNKSFWSGVLVITATMKDGEEIPVLMPFNVHWAGAKRKRNFTPHVTLPVQWKFFGIKEATIFNNGKIWVHFDSSISLQLPPLSASRYNWRVYEYFKKTGKLETYFGHVRFGKMYHRDKETMNKYWKKEYVEVKELETLEQLIRNRLINKTEGTELLNGIRLTHDMTS
jgi:hypothetical protein